MNLAESRLENLIKEIRPSEYEYKFNEIIGIYDYFPSYSVSQPTEVDSIKKSINVSQSTNLPIKRNKLNKKVVIQGLVVSFAVIAIFVTISRISKPEQNTKVIIQPPSISEKLTNQNSNKIEGTVKEALQKPIDHTSPEKLMVSYYSAYFSKDIESIYSAYSKNHFSSVSKKDVELIISETLKKYVNGKNYKAEVFNTIKEGNGKYSVTSSVTYNNQTHNENALVTERNGKYYIDDLKNISAK